MKKKILSFALALVLVLSLVPIASPPVVAAVPSASIIQDPAFYKAVLEVIGKSDGHVITADDVAGITFLDVMGRNIASLAGIEHFTALTWLNCGGNQLTTLDMSNNTALETLHCAYNRLTLLDVSKNVALKYLYLWENQLTALDVGNNTALEELFFGGNRLTMLDVSKAIALTGLDCNDNRLTTLDVSNNTALAMLHCGGNQLTVLDVSNNPALIGLWCYDNRLTTLDVSKNAALKNLDCWGNQLTSLDVIRNTALETLYLHHNQLTALDVSKNTVLNTLYCHDNQLTALDVSRNTALTTLCVPDNQLTALVVNPALESLECYNNQLTSLDVSKNAALKYLYCYNNNFPSKSAIIGLDESRLMGFTFDLSDPPFYPHSLNLGTASAWAKDGIANAITQGFVPVDLQDNYTNVITRAEFCRMAIKWLEYRLGKNIDVILADNGVSRRHNAFSDTNDPDILAAYALAITSGTNAPTDTTSGTFAPERQITREQAATMIRNVCRAAGMDVSNVASAGFEDIGSASNWAVDGINYVRNAGIMAGTRTTPLLFSPKAAYTREQSIITFNNIEWYST